MQEQSFITEPFSHPITNTNLPSMSSVFIPLVHKELIFDNHNNHAPPSTSVIWIVLPVILVLVLVRPAKVLPPAVRSLRGSHHRHIL